MIHIQQKMQQAWLMQRGNFSPEKNWPSSRCWKATTPVYQKKNDEYWEADIFEQRRKRPQLRVASTEDDEPPITEGDVDTMTLPELKTILKEMGIATKVLNF